MKLEKALRMALVGLAVLLVAVTIRVASAGNDKPKAPIELWETLCNRPELKSITVTATYNDGRVETNDYYCVR